MYIIKARKRIWKKVDTKALKYIVVETCEIFIDTSRLLACTKVDIKWPIMAGSQLLFAKYAPHEAQTMTTAVGPAAANPGGSMIEQAIIFAASRFGDTAFSALLMTTAVRGGLMEWHGLWWALVKDQSKLPAILLYVRNTTGTTTYKHTHTHSVTVRWQYNRCYV